MGHLIFTLQAPNFEQWYAVYQSREALRQAEGIHEAGIYRSIHDEQGIVLHLEVDDVERALAFFSAPGFRAAQAQAKVTQVALYVATPAN